MKEPTRGRAIRCAVCRDCNWVKAQDDWGFHGCFHKPYKGKWIVEIEKCPKESESEQNAR